MPSSYFNYSGAPLPGAAQDYAMAGTQQQPEPEPEPVVVPSQWKVGAVLDRLRFPQYGGDWDALMVALYGEGYQACMPRSTSPLSAEDMARESFSPRPSTSRLTSSCRVLPQSSSN